MFIWSVSKIIDLKPFLKSALSNCRQITFASLTPVFTGQYQDEWNTNQDRMKNTTPYYIVFHVLKVLLFKMSHQIFYFLLFYIKFYISRHLFSQIFRTFFNIIRKKVFVTSFSFLTDSLKTPYPRLNGQIFLSVIFLSFGSFHLVYLLGAHMKLNGQKRLNEMEEEFWEVFGTEWLMVFFTCWLLIP